MIPMRTGNLYINRSMATTVNIQKILFFSKMKLTRQYIDRPEMHDFWEMLYLESGEVFVQAGDKEILLLPGEIIFHKPSEVHCTKNANDAPAQTFYISFYIKSAFLRHGIQNFGE